jgi:hypothetical protein
MSGAHVLVSSGTPLFHSENHFYFLPQISQTRFLNFPFTEIVYLYEYVRLVFVTLLFSPFTLSSLSWPLACESGPLSPFPS